MICGLGSTDSTDMTLKANGSFQEVRTTDLKFVEGRPEVREHDACYYEITAVDIATLDEQIMDKGDGYKINIRFLAKTEMNVYIYEG